MSGLELGIALIGLIGSSIPLFDSSASRRRKASASSRRVRQQKQQQQQIRRQQRAEEWERERGRNLGNMYYYWDEPVDVAGAYGGYSAYPTCSCQWDGQYGVPVRDAWRGWY